jgi:small subunit ribosomal protein S20
MAHSLSAKKRARQNTRRRQRNRAARSHLKTLSRQVVQAAAGEPRGETALRQVTSALDKAARKNAIHWRKAARKKAQLARLRAGPKAGAATKPAESRA